MLGECGGGWVVEDEGGGESESGGGVESVAQFDGGEGVEAVFFEGSVGGDGVGGGVPQDSGGVAGDEVEEGLVLLAAGPGGEPVGESSAGVGAAGGGAASGWGDEGPEQWRDGGAVVAGVLRCRVMGTWWWCGSWMAWSNRARPWSLDRVLPMRVLSRPSRWPVMVEASAHRPQASDRPGRPRLRR
ncbi:hypothetical protein GCM10027610_000040 [Dactylosporangium cerinum]